MAMLEMLTAGGARWRRPPTKPRARHNLLECYFYLVWSTSRSSMERRILGARIGTWRTVRWHMRLTKHSIIYLLSVVFAPSFSLFSFSLFFFSSHPH